MKTFWHTARQAHREFHAPMRIPLFCVLTLVAMLIMFLLVGCASPKGDWHDNEYEPSDSYFKHLFGK
jgi:hypothetical protein